MRNFKKVALAAVVGIAAASSAHAATNTVEAPTGFFLPGGVSPTSSPYYRGSNEDWGWTHTGMALGFTTASLNISSYDVDDACGFGNCEVDEIYAYDDGVPVLLGTLTGLDNAFSFTEFNLGANFFDDIAEGLQIAMDIDVLNGGWIVTLAKSVITTDGSNPGNPNPGTPAVPLPAAGWLLLAGMGGLAGMARKRKL